jgi:2-keto-4-pentenoate hydratase/2-oxohepta-3-ene-1,7-dioic acid hydratase in catechol pathway
VKASLAAPIDISKRGTARNISNVFSFFLQKWQEGQPRACDHVYAPLVNGPDQIIAIGRNYAEHIKELKNVTPTEPFFFLKPTTSYLPNGGAIEIPAGIHAHHEGRSIFRRRFKNSRLTSFLQLNLPWS